MQITISTETARLVSLLSSNGLDGVRVPRDLSDADLDAMRADGLLDKFDEASAFARDLVWGRFDVIVE
jgi:hypothetical protein